MPQMRIGATVASPATPPSRPGADLNDPRVQVGHLLRRAGFGATPSEFNAYLSTATNQGIDAVVDQLLGFASIPDDADAKVAAINPSSSQSELQRWWIIRMRYTSRPLQEKMVYFWANILTSDFAKVENILYLKNQNQLYRDNALGKYDRML